MDILKRIFAPKKRKKHPMRHENDIIGNPVISLIDGDGTVWVQPIKEHPFVFKCTNNIAVKRKDGQIEFFFQKAVGINYPDIKTYKHLNQIL